MQQLISPTYREIIDDLRSFGSYQASRYGDTYEMLGEQVQFAAGAMVSRKGVNDALGFMELMQVVAGVFDKEQIRRVAPSANLALFTEKMAYGPRIVDQVPELLRALQNDENTRQAVLYIGKPEDGPTADQPCTTTMQFLIRDDQLHAFTSMRSWDVVKGLTYDLIVQGGLTRLLSHCLGIEHGVVTCTAGSLHLYVADVDKEPIDEVKFFGIDDDAVPDTWPEMRDWAKSQVYGMKKTPDGIWVHKGSS